MKRFLYLAAMLLCSVDLHAQTGYKALFIGNSYTYVNDLPGMLDSLCNSGAVNLQTESSAPGGYTFQNHSTYATTLNYLATPGFDFMVLQEQSQRPSFPQSQVQQEVYPYATQLDTLFHAANPCAQTVFFMTWGRKYGDAQNCQFWTPVCTYEGMQFELRRSYLNMAQQNQAIVAPVGVAWWEAMMRDTTIELYNPDESHPAVTGTYLAACVFYGTMFRQPSLGLGYRGGLDSLTATFLQQVADDVVFDSLAQWRIGLDDLSAGFEANVISNMVSFTDTSSNATSWHWDFGDGNSSTQQNPQHTYAISGSYMVTLTVSDGCDTMSVQDTVNAFVTGVDEEEGRAVRIVPNPSKGVFKVSFPEPQVEILVCDLAGRIVRKIAGGKPFEVAEIDLTDLGSGLYVLQYAQAGARRSARLMVD